MMSPDTLLALCLYKVLFCLLWQLYFFPERHCSLYSPVWQRLNMQHVSVCLRWGRRKEIFKLYCRFKALESFLILSIIFLDFLDHWMATRAYPCAPHTLKTSCFLCELVPVQLRAVGGSLSPCFPTSPGLLVSVFKPLSAASPTYSSTSNSSLLSSNSR